MTRRAHRGRVLGLLRQHAQALAAATPGRNAQIVSIPPPSPQAFGRRPFVEPARFVFVGGVALLWVSGRLYGDITAHREAHAVGNEAAHVGIVRARRQFM